MASNITGDGKEEELDEELELLRAMWSSEDELEIQRPPVCEIARKTAAARLVARLAPNTGGEAQSQFLRCEVIIMVPYGYPGEPEDPVSPLVHLGASSGLTDARRAALLLAMEELLRSDVAGMPGAMPAILEAAQERLTAWNDEGPTGQCPVCLAELGHDEDAAGQTDVSAAGLLQLPCHHVLHAACFAQFWEAEWSRQRESGQWNGSPSEANATITISEAVVACPECRQVASWAAVPQIHPLLEHLVAAASVQKMAAVTERDHNDEELEVEQGAEAEEDTAFTYIPSPPPPQDKGASRSRQQQQQPTSASARVDMFEVIMPRGLRTRLKPKWDARDQEGPILRNGACGIVAEYVEGKDATYLRPEGTDYWLPLNGGRNNCKMVRIDQDMPRPLKAPTGWIHGESCLGVDAEGSSKSQAAKLAGASSLTEGRASGKDRKKKTKGNNAAGGYASGNKLLGA